MYSRRADGFAQCAAEAAAREQWDVAVANAVHAAISMADALTVHYSGQRPASQGHDESIRLFLSLTIEKKQLNHNSKHLTSLLQKKSTAEYEERSLSPKEGQEALQRMERFLEWAKTKLP